MYLSSCSSAKRKSCLSKNIEMHEFRFDQNSDLILLVIKARFPNPETGSTQGCLLNINQILNIEQLLNTNQLF